MTHTAILIFTTLSTIFLFGFVIAINLYLTEHNYIPHLPIGLNSTLITVFIWTSLDLMVFFTGAILMFIIVSLIMLKMKPELTESSLLINQNDVLITVDSN